MLAIFLAIVQSNQYYWADNYQYKVRTESNTQKINFVMLADELYDVPCGRKTAGWVRAMWHDFGTYNVEENTGGVDGSILFELNRLENTRLDTPTYTLANYASNFGVTLADTISLAAIIAIRKCGGPKIPFYYGRDDTQSANPTGRMLFTNATFDMMVDAMVKGNGLSFPQFVASIGVGHTIAKLNKDFLPMREGPLDTTIDSPNSFDNLFFQNLLINNTDITVFRSDKQLLTDPYSLRMVRRLSRSQSYFFQLTNSVITWMTTAGWDSLFYLNIWKYLEGPQCVAPTTGPINFPTPFGSRDLQSPLSPSSSVASAAADQSKGNETSNVIIDPNAVITKPDDVVKQEDVPHAKSNAFTPVNNEQGVSAEDLPAPGPVPLK